MSGAVLTFDDFGPAAVFSGLNDRVGHVKPATAATEGISMILERQGTSLRVLRISTGGWLSRMEIETELARLRPAFDAFARIAELPAGWNSYNARPISLQNVRAALEVLLRHMPKDSALPQVVPTVRGGIQLEWHAPSVDIEVYVTMPQDISFFAENLVTGEVFEGPLTGNESRLAMWISSAR